MTKKSLNMTLATLLLSLYLLTAAGCVTAAFELAPKAIDKFDELVHKNCITKDELESNENQNNPNSSASSGDE